jgi:hypothetical protein
MQSTNKQTSCFVEVPRPLSCLFRRKEDYSWSIWRVMLVACFVSNWTRTFKTMYEYIGGTSYLALSKSFEKGTIPALPIFCPTSGTALPLKKIWWNQFLKSAIDSNRANSAWILSVSAKNYSHFITSRLHGEAIVIRIFLSKLLQTWPECGWECWGYAQYHILVSWHHRRSWHDICGAVWQSFVIHLNGGWWQSILIGGTIGKPLV